MEKIFFFLNTSVQQGMNKQFYTYVHIHTHTYRTLLAKKEDDNDNMQTYCSVKDISCTDLAKIMPEGSREEQRQLGDKPCTT